MIQQNPTSVPSSRQAALQPPDESACFPLAVQQQHHLLQHGENGRACLLVAVQGELHPRLQADAWRRVQQRHPILQVAVGDAVLWEVDAPVFTELVVHDQPMELADLAAFHTALPNAAPCLSVARDTRGVQHLALSVPALQADARSLHRLLHEIAADYGKPEAGEEDDEEAVDYLDFIALQEDHSSDENDEVARARHYWANRETGKGATPPLPWEGGANNTLPSTATLPNEIVQGLERVSTRLGVAVDDLAAAAWWALLWRMCGNQDPVLTRDHHCRFFEALENVIGVFNLALPVTGALDEDDPVHQLALHLKQQRSRDEAFLEHHPAPLKDEEAARRTTAFSFLSTTAEHFAVHQPLVFEWRGYVAPAGPMPLALTLFQDDNRFWCSLQSPNGAVAADNLARITRRYLAVLAQIVRDPYLQIARLDVLLEEERALYPAKGPFPEVPFQQDWTLVQFVADQVRQRPNAVAVVDEQMQLTYAELFERVGRVAGMLRRDWGVGPEVRVGLSISRSVAYPVNMLAVLAAGGTFVPVDRKCPHERLCTILRDSGAVVLISDREHPQDLPVPLISSDSADTQGELPPQPACSPKNAAYMIYTSGTTGRPKGAVLHHVGVANLIGIQQRRLGFAPGMQCLQWANFGFDGHIYEMSVLASGMTLHFAHDSRLIPGPEMEALLLERKIDTAAFLPTVWASLDPDKFPLLTCVQTAGEACPRPIMQKWSGNGRTLANLYGPTECTVWVTTQIFDGSIDGEPPIGYANDNIRVYVLDTAMRPLPAGFVGELYLGGPCLSRGYANQPAKTAESFVPDPFATTPGERLYRSGDLAMHLPAADGGPGPLVFISRRDRQIKLRGYRIETGEIEAVLASHPAVNQALVEMRETQEPGGERTNKKLVAYLTRADQGESRGQAVHHVDHWRSMFDAAEYDKTVKEDPEFNIGGWNSSFLPGMIPTTEMREWVDATVARILSLNPRRVMEVGCGSGLLLFPISRRCERYTGTDFSAETIKYVAQVAAEKGLSERVETHHREANALADMPPHDTIVVNSVIQYFPDLDYLNQVMGDLIGNITEQGCIFLGDVRHLPTLPLFHAECVAYNGEESWQREDVRRRLTHLTAAESELVVDPTYFTSLCDSEPRVTHVEILPKRGVGRNELNLYRYDVVVHVGGKVPNRHRPTWLDWRTQRPNLADMARHLAEEAPLEWALTRVANARIDLGTRLSQWLVRDNGPQTLADWRQSETPRSGLDVEDLYRVASDAGYQLTISWAGAYDDGSFDLVFHKQALPGALQVPERSGLGRAALKFANNPTAKHTAGEWIPRLRQFLRGKLPENMVPEGFVFLDRFPLTTNGKIDRQALPEPEAVRAGDLAGFVAPRSPREEMVAAIWAEALGIEEVGVHDNFFDLGGHSLLATRVITRLNQVFKSGIPVSKLFESPTVAAMTAAATAFRRGNDGLPPLVPVSREQPLPLSFTQQRLWFLNRLEPDSAFYNIPVTIRFQGRLDVSALTRAWHALQARHEILRTRFLEEDGVPAQTVLPFEADPLPLEDFSHLAPAERERAVAGRIAQEEGTCFDLAADAPLRLHLLRLSEDEHLLVGVMHHIIADGWSMGRIIDEMASAYNAYRQDRDYDVTPLSIQYADFAAWQRSWLQGAKLQQLLDFWRKQLQGAPPLINLPLDFPRPATQTFRGRRFTQVLPAGLAASLNGLVKSEGATLFIVMLSAYKLLLARYTDQQDVCVGSPIANRSNPALEPLIGAFVNSLVLRTDLDGVSSFREAITRVRETALAAYDHQDIPFEKLVEALQPERNLSHSPLFQVWFALQNAPGAEVALDEVQLTYEPPALQSAKFDLSLSITEHDAGIACEWEYNSDLFREDSIRRMAQAYRTLLSFFALFPDQHPSSAALAERPVPMPAPTYQAADWARTGTEARIRQQAALTPHAVAVRDQQDTLTYAELEQQAARLATVLQQEGVGPEVSVALYLDRSPATLIAILAIWKAGGAYLPLDPAYPIERLQYMADDAGVTRVICNADQVAADSFGKATLLPIQTLLQRAENAEPARPAAYHAARLAYTIYTSGSTGRPKGVQVPHGGLANFLASTATVPGMDASDILVAVTPLSFDIAGLELFLPLTVGAQVVIADRVAGFDGAALAQLLRDNQATVMQATPVTWRLLLDSGWSGGTHFRALCGGEALPQQLARDLAQRCGSLFNMYGPTETTIWSTTALIDSADEIIDIGLPIAETQAYILDAAMNPLPPGVPGELYLAGAGLARGYFNRPGLTAERFVPNPFAEASDSGSRLYRTGDRARWLCDAAGKPTRLLCLGRIDQQVKLRGFRIEPGEIEARLDAFDGIARSAVIVFAGEGEPPHLAAYLTLTEATQAPSIAALRAHLGHDLPNYMIPSSFTVLPEFPLTPNGKLNRRALPRPAQQAEHLQREITPPRGPLEQALVHIWADLLKQSDIGIHDNFFELGGHSLLITRLVSRLRQIFKTELPLRRLFEVATVAQLAAAMNTDAATQKRLATAATLYLKIATMSPEQAAKLLAAKRARGAQS